MWIIPKNYPLYSLFAQDMVASKEDLTLPGLSIESSLMWRSKPSQLRTWLQRWKRMPWFQRLCSRILKPSQHTCFETKLTLLLADIHANHFQQQGNEKAKTTQDTYGLTSENTSEQLDLIDACLKTSRDISVLDSEKSLQTWKKTVTAQRGEYSARKKSAHPIGGNGCLFWPTVRVSSANGASQKEIEQGNPKRRLETEVQLQKWPTPRASDSAGGDRTLNEKGQRITKSDTSKTYGANLSDKVKWATPNTMDHLPQRSTDAMKKMIRNGERKNRVRPGNLREQVNPDMVNAVNEARAEANNCSIAELDPPAMPMPENWPTPSARDSKGSNGYQETLNKIAQGKRAHMGQLPNAVMVANKTKAHLNPDWVEQLMGLPPGWTSLDGTCTEWQYGWHDGNWEADIPRVVESCDDRVDRIRLLGNGVVPLTACRAWQVLTA